MILTEISEELVEVYVNFLKFSVPKWMTYGEYYGEFKESMNLEYSHGLIKYLERESKKNTFYFLHQYYFINLLLF